MRKAVTYIILTIFILNNNLLLPLEYLLEPKEAYAEIVETIENTCPSDPTQNGRCALINTKVDGYSCKTIGGEQVCKDWWRKDFTYKCSGQFDPDTILAQVGDKYCEYKNECSEWIDVDKHGGTVSCRIYIDVNRPGCSEGTYNWQCIANDCGDLFDRCTLKQYVRYSDIPDKGNTEEVYYCDPVSGMCGTQPMPEKSGVKLGVYTFSCPSEVRQVCKSYTGKLVCPDGRTQVCNKVKTCKQTKNVTSTEHEIKSCTANRNMQTFSYPKNSPEAKSLKENPLCIKIGETTQVTPHQNFTIIGGWDANGGSKNCFYSMGWDTLCSNISENKPSWEACWSLLNQQDRIINYLNYVFATQQASKYVIKINSVSASGMGNYAGCFGSGNDDTDVYMYIDADVEEVYENFNCYQNSFQDCSFDGVQCNRVSSTDIDALECVEYDLDVEDSRKVQCKRFIVNYDCPKQKEKTECADYEEVLKCNDGVYPIRDVRLEGYDFGADFMKAMAYAQAANELKHVWSGESYRCESGLWWLFDQMSLGDYLLNKAIGFALSYLGSEVFTMIGGGSAISNALGCANSLWNTATNYTGYRVTYDNLNNNPKVTFYDPNTNQEVASFDGSGTKGCFNAVGMKLAQTVGLSPEQAAKVLAFFGNPIVQFTIGFVIDIVTSIKKCSTCDNEKCAIRYNQYKEYSLISNRLCHYVDSKCTWKLDLGIIKKCLRRGYRYCCYNSKFARILVEQAYKQLGYSWGDYDNAQCTNLTFDDLSRLDFDSMDFSEFIQEIESKMKGKLDENKLNQTIKDRLGM